MAAKHDCVIHLPLLVALYVHTVICTCNRMTRKFRLSQKKNEERKKYAVSSLPVRISLSVVTVFHISITLSQLRSNDKDERSLCPRILPNLSVFLPLSYFACLSLPTVSALRAGL